MKKRAFIFLSILFIFNIFTAQASAGSLLNVQKDIDKNNADKSQTQVSLDQIKKDIASLTGPLYSTEEELDKANEKVSKVRKDLKKVETDLEEKKESLAYLTEVRNLQIKYLYINPGNSTMELFLISNSIGGFATNAIYQKEILAESKGLIKIVNEEIASVEKTRLEIASLKKDLEKVAGDIQTRFAAIQSQFYYSVNQQDVLSNRLITIKSSLKNLTAKQERLVAKKIGESLSTGNLAPAGDPNASVNFNPGFSPAFAGFSFGAYTHRNGMSQYGALGRAIKGQSAGTILAVYYPGTTLRKNYSTPSKIVVSGTNDWGQKFNGSKEFKDGLCYKKNSKKNCIEMGGIFDFEHYLKHLYEVPTYWHMEVLKAQAVAARSYAVRYGSPICPTQYCQVVKWEHNSSRWGQAVDDTRKWVLTGGSGSYQYSSTSGGYLNTSGWDTTSRSKSSWPGGAYENIAGSPWFYKGWYRTLAHEQEERRTGRKVYPCGRSHPWLTETQFADILNSWVVYTKGTQSDKNKVITWDTACWGGSPYTIAQMKSRANQLGGSYSRVSGISTGHSNNGFTSSVSLQTNRGAITIGGQIFRDVFNLRAPGYLVLKTTLFNIERK